MIDGNAGDELQYDGLGMSVGTVITNGGQIYDVYNPALNAQLLVNQSLNVVGI